MASLPQLLRGGSFAMGPDGTFTFSLEVKTKFKWQDGKLKRKLGEATAKALYLAGADVREATKKGMSHRSPLTAPRQWKIADRMGFELIARVSQVPKSDRVTSWKTARFPEGYLRSQIQSDYTSGKKSVVVGPEAGGRNPRVNYLLERGGMATYYFVPGGKQRRSGTKVYGTLTNRPPRLRGTRDAQSGYYRFSRTIKPRGFMAKGLAKALPKIPERFRGKLNVSTGD